MKLLFVCTGNLHRSPMAAGIAAKLAAERGLSVEVQSAGTLGLLHRPADPLSVKVCAEIGIDLTAHRSQGLSDALVSWADSILVMEVAHALAVRERFPDRPLEIVLLGPYAGVQEVPDPVGAWTPTVRKVRDLLRTAVDRWLTEKAGPRAPA